MQLTIFQRLIIGYLIILFLAMTVSVYAIAQLRQLENLTQSILFIDNRMIDYEKKLSNTLLSMMRYEKKYVIIKDNDKYDNYARSSSEFDENLEKTLSVADSAGTIEIVVELKRAYHGYKTLFDEEVEYLRSGQEYPETEFREKKEQAVNGITKGLKQLRSNSQQNTYEKVKQLGEAEVKASKVAIVIGVTALILGTVISIFITMKIIKPLAIIKKKTRKIAAGDFKDDLELSSPPEIKELAQAFNSMCSKLNELDSLKSDFFSLMSHELRTPLTTIKEGAALFLESMREEETTNRQKRLLTIINEESIRLINLVNTLLDFSKIEAKMMVYNYIETDMSLLINKVVREMGPLAEARNITLEIEDRGGLPVIKVDSERILQVLRNLLGNAIKFTPNGGDVRLVSQNEGAGIKVSVKDTGAGISEDEIELVFEKYQQTVLEHSRKVIGSGLGLFIVKQIIRAHGGKVWAESVPGHGSTFSFVLPV